MSLGAKVNEIQAGFVSFILPHMEPGNLVAHNMYDNLELPWTADSAQTEFPKDRFQRFDWDRDGVLSDGKDFFGDTWEFPLKAYEQSLSTVSAVTRWRESHPELVGTNRDCVAEVVGQMRQVLGEEQMRGGCPTVLLIFKRGEYGEKGGYKGEELGGS
jgi:hypothetical protein